MTIFLRPDQAVLAGSEGSFLSQLIRTFVRNPLLSRKSQFFNKLVWRTCNFYNSAGMPGRQSIYAAMQDIQSKTCIKFRQRRQEKDYVAISSFNQGCFSYVGRSGGKQQLNLGPGCWHKTTIIHELVHAIGFWHEQSREDRDEWITVQWKNIPQRKRDKSLSIFFI